jgi:gamma-glutamylcyclotransferase (GGCT)/AIG2-like uncharacterized protein YtfP
MFSYRLKKFNPKMETRDLSVSIYGTLREGQSNYAVMKELIDSGHAKFKYPGYVNNTCIAVLGRLPALYIGRHSRSRTVVDTYEITCSALDVLDAFEGHPTFYSRRDFQVMNPDGRLDISMVYTGPAMAIEAVEVVAATREDEDHSQWVSDWEDRENTIRMEMLNTNSIAVTTPPGLVDRDEDNGARVQPVDPFYDARPRPPIPVARTVRVGAFANLERATVEIAATEDEVVEAATEDNLRF